jgi:hypothetical protein
VLAGSLAVNAYQALGGDADAPHRRPSPVVQVPPTVPCEAAENAQASPYIDPHDGLCIELLGSTG